MKSNLKKLFVTLAVVAVAAAGTQACIDEEVAALLLGSTVGPTKSQVQEDFLNSCGWVGSCDGVIEPEGASAGEKYLSGIDNDFEGMMIAFIEMTWFSSYSGDIWDEFWDFAVLQGLEELEPGESLTVGPLSGVVSLNRACAPGTGSLTITLQETFENPMVSGAAAKGPGFPNTAYHETYALSLSNCQVSGDLTAQMMSNEQVTLSGNVVLKYDWIKDDGETETVTGSLIINPGAVEPAGEPDPTLIWGYNERVVFGMSAESSAMVGGFDTYDGGVCYGDTVATEAGCDEGIFMPADDFYDLINEYD